MGFFSRRKNRAQKPAAPSDQMGYLCAALQGIGSRENQEDAVAVVNDADVIRVRQEGLFAVVADGMGGMADGRAASSAAVASLLESFSALNRGGNIAGQLHDAMYRASGEVHGRLGGEGGSTAIACVLYQEKLWFASVGDSYLFLLRDHQLNRLNREHNMRHKIYRQTMERGSIDPAPGRENVEAAALTEFLGMDGMDNVDFLLKPLPLCPGDVLLICSDGVGGVLDETVLSACLSQETPKYMCTAMEQEILKKASPNQDNYTAVVIRCVK